MTTTITMLVEDYRRLFVHTAYGYNERLVMFWHFPVTLRKDIVARFGADAFTVRVESFDPHIRGNDKFHVTFHEDADAIIFKLIYM